MYRDSDLRREYQVIADWIAQQGTDALLTRQAEADELFRRIGITFAVYGEGGDPDRLIPFDMVPRVFNAPEWTRVESGSIQRANALNAFIKDAYGPREIFKAGIVPESMIVGNSAYLDIMEGYVPPLGIYSHIVGVDLVRVAEDEFYVLEDNCRTPSGVSYVLQNREVMSRMFPDLFANGRIRPVDGYGDMLAEAMQSVAPPMCEGEPTLAILTPGQFNSAYYEHFYLADLMGVELVEGQDLFVEDNRLFMRTTCGPERIDVLYRRIDDDFIDPTVFREDSILGVPGLVDAYRRGNVTLANALGTGVADDKAVYAFVPQMIEYYLAQKPLLNNVPTYLAYRDEDLAYILDHLEELVVKAANESGGYGMLMGPASTAEERARFAQLIRDNPRNYIAQPVVPFSRHPTMCEGACEGRHVDLRPFVLYGDQARVLPGGLTRVALRRGSLVVNSSQGGGSKDTWVLRANPAED